MAAVFSLSGLSQGATVSMTDPVPNLYPEPDFITDGGVPYRWTVSVGAGDSTGEQLVRHVGAWSWDEDGNPATARGWTHTSDWVALTVTERVSLTLTLTSRENVSAPTQEVPTAVAGSNLYPAFTLFSGWDGDGSDDHTWNNQGAVAWAEDLTYRAHAINSGTRAVTATWVLDPGQYSVALGGNSPSTVAEGRQGYLATITTLPVPEPSSALLALMASALVARRGRKA